MLLLVGVCQRCNLGGLLVCLGFLVRKQDRFSYKLDSLRKLVLSFLLPLSKIDFFFVVDRNCTFVLTQICRWLVETLSAGSRSNRINNLATFFLNFKKSGSHTMLLYLINKQLLLILDHARFLPLKGTLSMC